MTADRIELGVSLYSFTERFVERDDYQVESMFATLTSLGVRRFELVGSQVFDHYPRPQAAEVDRILGASSDSGCEPFSYGGYVDWGRITGHSPGDTDVILDLTADLITARDLGCSHVRAGNLPPHLLPLVAQLAENYQLSVGIEVHAPSRPSDPDIQELLAAFDEIGSPRLGFIPDFGCFIERPAPPAIDRLLAMGASKGLLDLIISERHAGRSEDDLWTEVQAKGGGPAERAAIAEFFGFLSFGPADLEGFRTLLPRSLYFHSKFYHVDDDLIDRQIPIAALLTDIVESGFEGVLMSEYEGHAFHLDDAEEQVERHLRLERQLLSALAQGGQPARVRESVNGLSRS